MTMRVLHVIPAVAPRYGGPSTAIWPMVRALRELGDIDVEIATTDADGPDGRLTEADLPSTSGAIHLFRRRKGESLKYSSGLTDWLNVHAGDYAVIQTHSNWNHPVAAACRAARRARVPYVIRPCGMLSSYSWRRSKWKKRVYWWLRERENIRCAAGFHVTSEDERRELLELRVTAPIEAIALGIGNDAWETPVEPSWLREQCPQAGNRPIVLFLSRLHPVKGITDLLLPALTQLKNDAFLAIVGGDDDHAPGYAGRVESEIRRLGLGGRAALLGSVRPCRRWAAFDGAEIFVLPSHSESFGIVVPEAMARGKPVVVTTGVQFAEHVAASGGGTVVRPDPGEVAASLDLWLADPAARVRAGGSGRRYVQEHFTWRRTAEQLAELYRRVCGVRSAVRGSNG